MVLLVLAGSIMMTPDSRPNPSYSGQRMPLITEKLDKFLISEKDNPESNFTLVLVAKKRGGKTNAAFSKIIDKILVSDLGRQLCLYCDPPLLYTLLTDPHTSWEYFMEKYGLRQYNPSTWEQRKGDELAFKQWLNDYVVDAPTRKLLENYDIPAWSARVYIANEPSQIRGNSIVFIDDMKRLFNAKSALRKDTRAFGEALTITSHQRVCVVGCIQDDQMSKDIRRAIDIIIYKALTPEFIKDCDMPYIQARAADFVKLPVKKGYLHSTYSSANYNFVLDGIVEFDQLPWFTMEHSLNASQTSFSSDKDRLDRVIDETKPIVEEILKHYGDWALKSKMDRAVRWFITLNHRDRANYFLQNYDTIMSQVAYELVEKKMTKKRQKESEGNAPPLYEGVKADGSFGDFIREYLEKCGTAFWKERGVAPETEHEVIALIVDGMTQEKAAKKLKIRVERANTIWAYYWGKDRGKLEEYAPIEYQVWKLYEKYEAARVKGKVGGENGVPDVFYLDGTFGECKLYNARDDSITFSKIADFGPSVGEATKNMQAYFHASIRNIQWIRKIKGREIDYRAKIPLGGDDKVVVDREKGFLTGVGRDLHPIEEPA